MGRLRLGMNVFEAAVDRLEALYAGGHRLLVSFSGGKDSTVCLELAIMAARRVGRLPVEVVMQDEEAGYPGVYDFAERVAQRPEVKMHWLVMRQPMLNIFNRAQPYFWAFDPLLPPAAWLREPPRFAQVVTDKALELMVNPVRFPVAHAPRRVAWDPEDKREKLINVIGLRTEESAKRLLGLHSSGGYVCGSNDLGVFNARPIYDWKEPDVWRFIHEHGLDYCRAYDVFYKMGGRHIRIGPPTMTVHGIHQLQHAARAWPRWFDRLCKRLPGVRTAVQFGERAVSPNRRLGETWEQCFHRECLGPDVPGWIRDRASRVLEAKLEGHRAHATTPFPESVVCQPCGVLASWRQLAEALWGGDPFCLKTSGLLPLVEPEFFRGGAGTWAGEWEKITGRAVKVMF